VLRLADCATPLTASALYVVQRCFERAALVKPFASHPSSPERSASRFCMCSSSYERCSYFVAQGFMCASPPRTLCSYLRHIVSVLAMPGAAPAALVAPSLIDLTFLEGLQRACTRSAGDAVCTG